MLPHGKVAREGYTEYKMSFLSLDQHMGWQTNYSDKEQNYACKSGSVKDGSLRVIGSLRAGEIVADNGGAVLKSDSNRFPDDHFKARISFYPINGSLIWFTVLVV